MARSAAAIVRQVRQRARAELVATVLANEAATLRAWGPTLKRLNRALLTARPGEVDALVAQATRELAGVTLQHATRSITQGVGVGVRAGRVQRAALIAPNGPLHTPEAAALPAGISPQQARTITEATVNGAFARDRIPLSSRLYRNAGEVARDASSVVRESISARTGVFQAAETFIERNRDSMLVPIPQYTQDLIDAARGAVDSGDRRHLERLIEKHTAQMEALGEGALRADGLHSLRSTVRQFVRDVRTATPENIERIIAQHITDRAQYQARRIVRSETAEAHRRAFRADSDESPYTVGYRWVLSPSHPRPDVCFVAGTLVETQYGPRTIESICVGDQVLTHRGRFRRVTRLYRTTPDEGLLRLRFQAGTSRVLSVDATPNHPFATARGWIAAGDLREGDRGLALLSASEEHDHPQPCDTQGTYPEGFRQSAPSERQRTSGAGSHAEPRSPAGRTGTSAPRPDTTERRTSGSGSDRCHLNLLTTPGSQISFEPLTSEPESLPASSTYPCDACRSLGSPCQHSLCPCTPSSKTERAVQADQQACHRTRTDERDTQSSSTCDSASSERTTTRTSGIAAAHAALLASPEPAWKCQNIDENSMSCEIPSAHLESPPCSAETQLNTRGIPSDSWVSIRFVDAVNITTTNEVFNLEVEDDHTYFANEILVHNCDLLANQNLHGLGPGGYPKDQVPETPHPNCLCTFEAIIDEHYFRRQLAERRGEEAPPTPWVDENRQTANEWLAGQPASLRHQLLGPTRTSIFDAAPDLRHLVIDSRGVPIPVRQVLATTSFDPRVAGLFAGR